MKTKSILMIACVLALSAGCAGLFAQEPAQVRQNIVVAKMANGPAHTADQQLVYERFQTLEFADKVVKGAPYSGEAISETVQTLPDGNRISRKNTALLYRDGEGRTRREQTLEATGPLAQAARLTSPHKTVFISDPVAGASYILNPDERIAHKLSISVNGVQQANVPEGVRIAIGSIAAGNAAGTSVIHAPAGTGMAIGGTVGHNVVVEQSATKQQAKTESLGKKTIDGIEVEGTRSTITIPVGEIGNDRPIEIVSERWYSPQLQTTLLTTHNDPRFGETTYRLTNIVQSDQPHSLFEVPGDYTIKEDGARIEIKKKLSHQ